MFEKLGGDFFFFFVEVEGVNFEIGDFFSVEEFRDVDGFLVVVEFFVVIVDIVVMDLKEFVVVVGYVFGFYYFEVGYGIEVGREDNGFGLEDYL